MMKKTILMLAVLAALPANAHAKENQALCTFLPVKEHFVGADYEPGVDVDGNPVVPADIKQQSSAFIDVIKVPVDIDLVKNLNLAVSVPAGTEMKTNFGIIEVYKDSTVKYNGEVITEQAYSYCGKQPFDIESATADEAPQPIVEPVDAEKNEIIWSEE